MTHHQHLIDQVEHAKRLVKKANKAFKEVSNIVSLLKFDQTKGNGPFVEVPKHFIEDVEQARALAKKMHKTLSGHEVMLFERYPYRLGKHTPETVTPDPVEIPPNSILIVGGNDSTTNKLTHPKNNGVETP